MATVCKHCGKSVTGNASICSWCGGLLVETIECPGCKRKIPNHLKACQYCGTAIAQAPVAAPAVKPAAQSAPKMPDVIDCPKCKRPTRTELDHCETCGFVYVQPPEREFLQLLMALPAPQPRDPSEQQALMVGVTAFSQLKQGGTAKVLEVFERALQINKRCAWLWACKGISECRFGKYSAGIATLREALKLEPSNTAYAKIYRRLLDIKTEAVLAAAAPKVAAPVAAATSASAQTATPPAAVNANDPLMRATPQMQALYWTARGCSANNEGRYDEALSHFDKAFQIDPRCGQAFHCKMLCLANAGRAREAVAAVQRLIQSDPQSRGTQDLLKQLETMSATAAKTGLGVLNERQPGAVSMSEMASALDDQGRLDEALSKYDEVLALDPVFANAWTDKGYVLNKMGRYEDAIFCFNRAIEIDAFGKFAWNNKGNSLLVMGRAKDAAACYERALVIDPNFQNAKTMLNEAQQDAQNPARGAARIMNAAANLKQAGRMEAALFLFDQALRLNPYDAAIYFNKANTLLVLNRHEEALKSFDIATEASPNDKRVWFNRGRALEALNRLDEALQSYKHALQLDAQYENAKNAIAEVQQQIDKAKLQSRKPKLGFE